MKNIYLLAFTLLMSVSVSFGQSRVYAPELQYPENGAVDQMPEVELNWNAVTGGGMVIQYEVQISTDEAFTNPVEFPLTEVTALDAPGLMFGAVYYWRVRAHDGDEVSDWSETWSFSVLNVVDVYSPADGSEVNPEVDIMWRPVTGVDFYEIMVDTSYSWTQVFPGFATAIKATFVVDANNYGGVGEDGLIFYYDGEWKIAESGTTKDLLGVYFVDADNGWAVGKTGTVVHYDGTSWTSVDVGATKDLNAVYFADANNGWVVGKSGVIYYYNGTEWTQQDAGTTKDFNAVWAISSTDVWAAGKSGTIAHYDGSVWTSDTPGSKDFMSLWFNSATDGWAVGKSGRVAHYDGTEWTEETTGISKVFYGVAFNGTEGYIVGQTGTMLQYDGSSWKKVTSGTNSDIYGIWFAEGTGFLGGKYGAAYTYSGGGFDSPYKKIYKVDGSLTSLNLTNLFFGSTYYYKVRMGHSNDTCVWGAPVSFRVQRSPELKSPSNGTSNIALKILLSWYEFEGIHRYNVQISDNADFTGAYTYSSDSTSYMLSGMGFGKQYYWHVKALQATDESDWSETWSFTTVNSVNLVAPADGTTDVNTCPLLEWEAIPGVSEYEVWFDVDENFTNPLSKIESNPTSQCQSQLEKGTDYYWKVRAIVALDTSDWSPVWKFTTESGTGIDEMVSISSVSVYPNPSNGSFTVQTNSLVNDVISIQVVDITGKIIYTEPVSLTIGKNSFDINLSGLSSGYYQVNLRKGNSVITKKLMIK